MYRSRFLWKLYTGYVVLILLTVAIVGIMVSHTIESDTLEEIQGALLTRAELIRGFLTASRVPETDTLSPWQRLIEDLDDGSATRLTIVGPDGTVLADSEEDPSLMDDHGSRPEILQARSHGIGRSTRFSNTLKQDMMYLALPISGDGPEAGYVRTSLPLTAVEERLASLRRLVVTGAVIASLIALPLGFFVARRTTAPLSAMTQVAAAIARGEFGRRVATTRRDEIGQLAGALNTMAEQSERRMEALTRERNELRAILAGMVEGVVAVDAGEHIVHINEVAGNILGVDPADSLGRSIREVTRAVRIAELCSRALRGSDPVTGESRVLSPAGDRTIEVFASRLPDSGDALTGAVIVLHDVTDLRHLESVRREFVANVSHELRTPITAAQGLVETMLVDEQMARTTRGQFLEKTRAQISRLSAIVSDLLTLSRLESVPAPAPVDHIDVDAVVGGMVESYDRRAQEEGLTLEIHRPSAPLLVNATRDALEQIAGNLLDNALKYTETGGRVTLEIRQEADAAVFVVTDTGIGIEPVHQERIFERFYRVDKARSRERGGTGLGLAIVKHHVRSLGGAVSVASTAGVGSTFRVRLPLASPEGRPQTRS